eukprot:CAMPEP_0194200444 /NCGR_PEP_ID=MMETSP0156-20130528/1045_1 /TAXON_ID=33649 /ORGANISM="Thalassionema nitzschioides, Strain L26-B" /LENGTH=411 /DNA_ID=CAMNT_0038925439 /DNA_START=56 /DNA_END=1288 /DNA_ORIENTATION=+
MAKTQKSKSLIGAFTGGLLSWIFFYLFILLLLILDGWSRIHPTVTKEVIEKVDVPVQSKDAEVLVREVKDFLVLDDKSKNRNDLLMNVLLEAKEAQAGLLSDLETRLESLFHNIDQPSDYPKPEIESREPTSTDAISKLLEQESLSQMNEKTLMALLDKSFEELTAAIEKNATTGLQELFAMDFTRDKGGKVESSDCPSPPVVARLSGLQDTIGKFRRSLNQKRKEKSPDQWLNMDSVRTSFEDGLKAQLPSNVQAQVNTALEPPVTLDEKTPTQIGNETDRVCLLEDQLIAMVDLALKNPANLQNSLPAYVKELDESEIILDAVLPPPPTSLKNARAIPVNLRQVLDQEWFLDTSTRFFDSIIDWTSGYHDGLDNAVDKLAGSGDASIGRILISRFLKWAGEVPLPDRLV